MLTQTHTHRHTQTQTDTHRHTQTRTDRTDTHTHTHTHTHTRKGTCFSRSALVTSLLEKCNILASNTCSSRSISSYVHVHKSVMYVTRARASAE